MGRTISQQVFIDPQLKLESELLNGALELGNFQVDKLAQFMGFAFFLTKLPFGPCYPLLVLLLESREVCWRFVAFEFYCIIVLGCDFSEVLWRLLSSFYSIFLQLPF